MAGKPEIALQEIIEQCQLSDELLKTCPSEEHLKRLSKIVDDHETLGDELGLTTTDMTDIGSEKALPLRRSATLKKWKQIFAFKATYRKLIEALLNCRRADLAQQVCEWLRQSASPEQPSASASASASANTSHSAALPTSPLTPHTSTDGGQHGDQPEKSPSPAASLAHSSPREEPPDLGQVKGEEDSSQLRQEVQHLERKFEALLNATSDDLEKRNISVDTIRRSLRVPRASDHETDIYVVADHQNEIRDAKTVDALFDVLSWGQCWSFLNPWLLKRIINDHCSESQSIQHQKRKYLEELQEFRKATTARQFATVSNAPTLIPSNFCEVTFKMEGKWDGTLEDMENMRQNILRLKFLHGHLLNFMQPKIASISLVWAFPRSCPIETTILRIPPSFYLEHGIRRVLVKGVCVIDFEEEVVAMQQDVRLQLHEQLHQKEAEVTSLKEAIKVMASLHSEKLKETEEKLKATIESNKELRVAFEEAKSVQRTLQEENSSLESRVKKYELQLQEAGLTGRSVSAPHLHAMEQEKLLRKKDMQITDYEDKITRLNREVETLKKQLEKEMLLMQHEDKERELLQEFKRMERREPLPSTGDQYVESVDQIGAPASLASSISREEQPPGQIVDAPEVYQPDLDQAEGEEDTCTSELRQKVRHLEKKFEDLLNQASDDLEKRKVSVHKIRRSLFVRRAADTQTDVDLVAGHRHEIQKADTVDDLFDVLSGGKCWDFLNPGLLKRIIDDHCSESQGIQHKKNEYLEELQQFRKATTAREFAKVCNVSTLSPKFSEGIFEMGKDWDNATLEDVENLKQKIRGQGCLSDHMFNFRRSKN